jgi:thioredoxin reductase (NADPH)
MVRSVLLRGFDQDMAERIGTFMTREGVNFVNSSVPLGFEKKNGKINVLYQNVTTKEKFNEEFDTVLLAIGRYAVTKGLNLDNVGVATTDNGKILVNEAEQSTIKNIYSIGDCAEGRPELTPPAIMVDLLVLN